MLQGKKCIAIIPVRKGSRRLPNKNILPFGNSNLLLHKIDQLLKVDEIDEILVSSDSLEMLDMARGRGCRIHKRNLEYSDEISKNFSEVVEHIVLQTSDKSILLWTPCVCPLVNDLDFSKALQTYRESVLIEGKNDSVISVRIFQEYLWNSCRPINYKLGQGHVPSQNLEKWNIVINGFCIASKEVMLENRYFFGKKPKMVEVDKSRAIDIDDEIDYRIALALSNTPPPIINN